MENPLQAPLVPAPETPPYEPTPTMREWIARQTWTFAKTVPEQPHWYVVRAKLPPEEVDGWQEMYDAIKTDGLKYRFTGRTYRYLTIDGWDYFTGPPGLMNRRHHLAQGDAEVDTWTPGAETPHYFKPRAVRDSDLPGKPA